MNIDKIESAGKNLRFHHIGLAVREPAKAIGVLTALGYTITPSIEDQLQNVNLVFCSHATLPAVEVIYPTESAGPLEAILKFHHESYYHICFAAERISTVLENFKTNGIRCVSIKSPEKAVLFNNHKVSFYYIDGFGVIELLEIAEEENHRTGRASP